MLSSLMNYRLYASDLPKTLARIEAQASVQREATYYRENIGKVRSVEDFVGDFRLLSYALKAHGLSEQIASPAFVRKILESDLADPQSFANRLSDPRYKAFAGAFEFSAAAAKTTLQSQAQTDRLVEAYSAHLVRGGAIAAEKASLFQARIGTVGSVDELLADPDLFAMVTKIAGFDPAITSRTFMRGVLLGGGGEGQSASPALQFLAGNFVFDPDGSVKSGGSAQSEAQTAEFIQRFFAASGQGESSQAAAFDARYFEKAAAKVITVNQLVDDPALSRVLRTAAQLPDGGDTDNALKRLFSLPADDENNPIAQLKGSDPATVAQRERLVALKAGFDFSGSPVTDGTRIAAVLDQYFAAAKTADTSGQIALRTNSFRVQLAGMNSINDLLGRDPVYQRQAFEYVLKAFDLDPATESTSKIRRVLTSDPSDPTSYVRRLNDPRYAALAAAFNFGPDGKVAPERLVQSVRLQQDTAAKYAASFGTEQTETQKANVRRETVAYLEAVGKIHSIEGLVGDTATLDYALRAHGLEGEGLTRRDIERLLTSDLSDPKSFARSFGDPRYTDFAGSFNFAPDGTIERSAGGVQGGSSLLTTQNLYLLQMLEEQAGQTSEGTRLALYFLRKSPDIKNAFSILADKALLEVARTALGLPQQFSQLDIDRQAAILESRLDFADFRDPKALDTFISRFTTLYDMNNGGGGASDPVLQLFGGGGGGQTGIAGLF